MNIYNQLLVAGVIGIINILLFLRFKKRYSENKRQITLQSQRIQSNKKEIEHINIEINKIIKSFEVVWKYINSNSERIKLMRHDVFVIKDEGMNKVSEDTETLEMVKEKLISIENCIIPLLERKIINLASCIQANNEKERILINEN